ncbi:hypothetical protein SASPL_105010 [Salvia splendens]|uniref:ZNF598/HEL2 PAH domain-containing protein n=1 Tax=Salvia splendens TaxID=180675 RepID=A0A8X8YNR7_SALSN|nr:hypothetical protein SASPL_105010 [Salvia splendens]
MAIQASFETASDTPPNSRASNDHGENADVDSLISPLESLGTTDPELPSRYRQAVSQSSMSGTLGDSAFPPLAAGAGVNQQSSQTVASSNRTMAAHLRRQSKKQASSSSSAPAWPAARQSRAVTEIVSVSSGQSTPAQIHPPSAATTSFASSLVEGNVHTANKSLVEKMRAALGSDEDKSSAFKDISGQYRLGLMDVETYLTNVDQFGLSHLVLELAGLLPNPQKQKELTDAYNMRMGKGKGKYVDSSNRSSVTNNLAENVISTVRALQSSYNTPEEEVEVLSKDGYRSARGKPAATVGTSPSQLSGPAEVTKPKIQMESLHANGGTNQNPSNGGGKGKQRKKASKFIRGRLGDGSVEALLDLRNSDQEPDPDDAEPSSNVPVRGVWRNGGEATVDKVGVKK